MRSTVHSSILNALAMDICVNPFQRSSLTSSMSSSERTSRRRRCGIPFRAIEKEVDEYGAPIWGTKKEPITAFFGMVAKLAGVTLQPWITKYGTMLILRFFYLVLSHRMEVSQSFKFHINLLHATCKEGCPASSLNIIEKGSLQYCMLMFFEERRWYIPRECLSVAFF